MLLVVDPAKRDLGWAIYDRGVLLHCDVSQSPMTARETLGSICDNHVRAIHTHVTVGQFSDVVCEYPEFYRDSPKSVPEDLIAIGAVGAYVAGWFASRSRPTTFVTPRVWKGQRPKEAIEKLALHVLDENEKVRVDLMRERVPEKKQHNAMDAVAIGLWFYKRIR